ncbi:MAG: DUF92 domain-containing protein [Chroococcidiopsidaceae cyanobacterium CP_BM_RX_35]|nr:DUF92 domain-containing protein [Chroococcidiopsidaceae cyanobacterium CP_BM_RX_35]
MNGIKILNGNVEALTFLIGVILSAIISFVGYKSESLSRSGVVGAMVTGTLIFGFGGWAAGLMLLAFFASSSALSHFREAQKSAVAEEKFSKGGKRDLSQALANGGMAALLAVVWRLWPSTIWFAALAGAVAAVNADTWATELGVLNPHPPRSIITGRVVPVGTSGGISPLGTGAALAGAAFIGLVAWLLAQLPGAWLTPAYSRSPAIILVAAIAGLVSALFDSFLGATVQQIYYCDHCQKDTERVVHSCGTQTRALRGWSWMDNDVVNFLASVVGAAVGAALVEIVG